MLYQTIISLNKFRLLLASFVAIAILLLTSAIVTAAGANTILDPSKAPSSTRIGDPENINAITAAGSEMMGLIATGSLKTGNALYSGCAAITKATADIRGAVVHAGIATASAIGSGVAYAGRAIGGGIVSVARLPGKAIASISNTKAVGTLVRPADTNQSAVPVIESQTSTELLAQYDKDKQQQLTKLIEGQKTANANLDGSIIAGDPSHGGYPAVWDNARQDSLVDTWGMYNRECVSYTAWKVYQTFGYMPYWGGIGNANQWVADAKAAGIPTSPTPRVHSVAISMHGYYGHAMWVEKVEGPLIYVSQYNLNLDGHYSEMWVNSNAFTYLYF